MVLVRTWKALRVPGAGGHGVQELEGQRRVNGWGSGKEKAGNRNQEIWTVWQKPGDTGLAKPHKKLDFVLRKQRRLRG